MPVFLTAIKVLLCHLPNIWPVEKIDANIQIAYQFLKDLTPEQINRGIKIFCLAHKEIYPNTNIIAYIRDYALGQYGIETAAEAWGKVLFIIKRIGDTRSPKFKNRITQVVVNAMNWKTLCESTNVIADRAHFMKMYDQIKERETFKRLTNTGGENKQ